MLARIAHRGPAGEGVWDRHLGGWHVALGHRRLSIIDVAGGAQPMENGDGAVVISYNATTKKVTIWVQSAGPKGTSATIGGVDFMKAVWSIWLGKIDQPSMGDQLIAKL